ncbi:MAG: gamma-glutamyltransferase family protein [Phycisphaerales bacterium JB063]
MAEPISRYPSARSPLYARRVVATSQPLAAQAGLDAMQRGGNAVDAALAAAITLTVVEPTSNGIGGDAFAMVWDGDTLHGYNGSGKSPAALTREHLAGRDAMPTTGWLPVTTPGAVDTWVKLSERLGRLPFADLFSAGIWYAKKGYAVGPVTASAWARAASRYRGPDFAAFATTFTDQGRAPFPGEQVRLPDHKDTLREIAETRGESFYRGELAGRIADAAAMKGGLLSRDDLAEHAGEWVEPMRLRYGSVEVAELPPNGQGAAALVALGVLDRLDLKQYPVDSADSVHLQVEAMKAGFAELTTHAADTCAMRIDPAQLITPATLDQHAAAIAIDRVNKPTSCVIPDQGTVYLSAADEEGMMVSFIQSNYMGFGSGVVVPGTGIAIQNRGAGFSLQVGHPNEVAGGKRPMHTIIPAFVLREGKPVLSFGVMGGHMQPQGHVQMVTRIFDYGQDPQQASDAPRWYVDEEWRIHLEPGWPPAIAESLSQRGHEVVCEKDAQLFGGAQLIRKTGSGYCAASDHRKEGLAAGD